MVKPLTAGQESSNTLLFLLRIPRPHLEPDGRAFEAEGLANLVFEETLEAEVQLDVACGKEHKGGRRDGGLGHIEDAHPLAHRHRRALEVDALQKAVHLPGGDALAAHLAR